MLRSQRLRLHELRQIHNLLGEITELGQDPQAWRAHALRGLRDLVHGQVAFTLDYADALPGRAIRPIQPIDLGWPSESARRRFYQYIESGESIEDPAAQSLFELHQRVRLVTCFRRQLVDDRTWYAAPSVVNGRHYADIDDFVCTTFALRPGMLHGFIIYRGMREPAFDLHERRIMRMFHVELLRLIRNTASNHATPNGGTLSPRLQQTLELLLTGAGVKDIAGSMQLSHHTVNDYMKELYRRMQVTSRPELMSKALAHRTLNNHRVHLPAELINGWAHRP
jgi:DNA-binding CsgD family transcriptional regulator